MNTTAVIVKLVFITVTVQLLSTSHKSMMMIEKAETLIQRTDPNLETYLGMDLVLETGQ